jgi:serine/threonine protein kinase
MTDQSVRIGRYDVEVPLAEGPAGRVCVARDPVLGRRVVIKVLRDDLPLGGELRERLAERIRTEARSVSMLSHPSLAVIHDMGDAVDGDASSSPYLVFEFLKGPSLRERLATGPVAPGEVASIARAVGAALAHAHGAGLFFGDVKAENILFTGLAECPAKLTEPGFAWRVWSDTATRGAAPTWAEASAPAHAAPELATTGKATAFSDQFSFAAAMYEALTGKRPFGGGSAVERAARIASGAREPLSVARPILRSFPHVDTIFDRALAKDPRKRFSSCDVFGSVLATELEGFESGRMSASSASSIVPRSTRRWQNAAAGLAVLVILSLVVLGQRHPTGEGASLTSVASAFSATLYSTHAPPPPPRAHAPRAAPPPPAAATAASTGPSTAAPLATAAPSVPPAESASSPAAGAVDGVAPPSSEP